MTRSQVNAILGIGVASLLLTAAMSPGCQYGQRSSGPSEARPSSCLEPARMAEAPSDSPELSARTDPLAFLRICREHYLATVHDYRCTFTKRERLPDGLSAEQTMRVLFREHPYSVDMRWNKNPGRAVRVLYQADRWVEDGRQMAHVQPGGILGLLAPRGVKRDIHGPAMTAESRRPIDHFGFKNTLDLIIADCERFQGDAGYDLRYIGTRALCERPCYVFERRLPYTGEGGCYPNRRLVVYIDREWLVPTGTFAYADNAMTELLGSYLLSDVEFNGGLTDADFEW